MPTLTPSEGLANDDGLGAILARIASDVRARRPPDGMVTRIVAIDGLGGSGKSSFALHPSRALAGAVIISTDDFATWETRSTGGRIYSNGSDPYLAERSCALRAISLGWRSRREARRCRTGRVPASGRGDGFAPGIRAISDLFDLGRCSRVALIAARPRSRRADRPTAVAGGSALPQPSRPRRERRDERADLVVRGDPGLRSQQVATGATAISGSDLAFKGLPRDLRRQPFRP
jgi:hypothetical protein